MGPFRIHAQRAANRPRTIFNQINYGVLRQRRTRRAESKFPPGVLRRTKEPPPHEVRSGGSFMSEDAPERKVALGPNSYGSLRDGVNPVVLILNSTGLDTSQGLAELLHHRADLGVASREGHGLVGAVNLVVDLANRGR